MTIVAPQDLNAAIALTRFGLGASPGEMAGVRADPKGWLLQQIRVQGADQPEGQLLDSRASLAAFRRYVQDRRALKQAASAADADPGPPPATPSTPPTIIMAGAAGASAGPANLMQLRRREAQPLRQAIAAEMLARTRLGISTPAGFRERWALFWCNHFTVSAAKFRVAVLSGPFEREAIRPHVFGRFEDLLVASSTHPGMLLYLDQSRSVGPDSVAGLRRRVGLNENLGREILELHTVGADAGYTQADVTEFARALTGYSVAAAVDQDADSFVYRDQIHEPGTRTVMGRRYDQAGSAQARAILADLAIHPKTAQRLARKIAAHFVADEPPPALTARLTQSWIASRGDLNVVARSLVTSPEAWTPQLAKFKTPNEFLISSYRAVAVSPETAAEVVQPLSDLGQRPFSAPQPNGWSDAAADWASGSAMVDRLQWSKAFADTHAPTQSPIDLASVSLGVRAGRPLTTTLARAETRSEAMTVLLMSPEFQRR